jgi:hypothetical protein
VRNEKTIIRKRFGGQVLFNDGHFAEIQTHGISGMKRGLVLDIIQTHIEDTDDTTQEFKQRFEVGMRLYITTVTEIVTIRAKAKESR